MRTIGVRELVKMRDARWAGRLALLLAVALTATVVAQGSPTDLAVFDQWLAAVKGYEDGQDRAPLASIELFVQRSLDDGALSGQVAERLAGLLSSPDTTLACKAFVCGQLRFVAGEAQVPVLAAMLAVPETSEMAVQTLQTIKGETAGQALRAALTSLRGAALIGLVNALGVRRDIVAVEPLATLGGLSEPALAAAALRALGNIGTPEAAEALHKIPARPELRGALEDASLRCAGRLAEAGEAGKAEALYRGLYESDGAPQVQLAGLSGLVNVLGTNALPLVLDAVASGNDAVAPGATRLLAKMAGVEATAALVECLPSLAPERQALAIRALADRQDPVAFAPVVAQMANSDLAVRLATVDAMAALGDGSVVKSLAALAAAESDGLQDAARHSLVRMTAADVDGAIRTGIADGDPGAKVELIRASVARGMTGLTPTLVAAAADADEGVRTAAWEALGATGVAEDYAQLVALLSGVSEPGVSKAATAAVVAVGRRVEPAQRAEPVMALLGTASPGTAPMLLHVLAAFGGDAALTVVRERLTNDAPEVRDAAVRALTDWPDLGAAADLLALTEGTDDPVVRALALRGYVRLARDAGEAQPQMLANAASAATSSEDRKQVLAALTGAGGAEALSLALGMLAVPEVRAEAELAVLKIAQPIVRTEQAEVKEAMGQLIETSGNEEVVQQAKALVSRAEAKVDYLAPAPYTANVIEARQAQLRGTAPAGCPLACYLDCGVEPVGVGEHGLKIEQLNGRPYVWAGALELAPGPFGTVAFDDQGIAFDVEGLDPAHGYILGFSGWDFDGNGRTQSVEVGVGTPRRTATLVEATPLPAHQGANAAPAQFNVPLDASFVTGETLRVTFTKRGPSNAVVSEVWLYEGGPAVAAQVKRAADSKRILIVTGQDYPGHKWRETAPVLAEELGKDPRLEVSVVEDPAFLAKSELDAYDAIVLHFMNWEQPDPGPDARANLQRFVEGGKGLMVVHFACGAFQEWPEFRNLTGRSYDPTVRPHDPLGPFQVVMTDFKHPITEGLAPFEITDELYTCLVGDRPIDLLAVARSKVDGKDYPMAFAFSYGQGRVFNSPLGHDVAAFRNPGAAELFRRGCAWVAGLPPIPGKTAASDTKKIVFIAGPPSHGQGEHEWAQDAKLLKQCLDTSPNAGNIRTEICLDGWPESAAMLDDADAIVLIADGLEAHPLAVPERFEQVRALMARGCGLACIHYAVAPPPGAEQPFLDWMGGYWEKGYSQNPISAVEAFPVTPDHPICAGGQPFTATDEYYYRIRFRDNDARLIPVMAAMLPLDNPQREVVAWTVERADGGRGFGFTGAHFHDNWRIDPLRKMVLNAILWTAKAPVPDGGVTSTVD